MGRRADDASDPGPRRRRCRRRITASFQAPKQPGRYCLVWDTRVGDGPWQSTLPLSARRRPVQQFVNVERAKGSLVPVDLSKSFNTLGIASGSPGKTGGFDGHGAVLPSEMLPPDVTSEVDGDPLLLGKPGLPLYPSGYYTVQTGTGEDSNHALSFLYPTVKGGLPNVVACSGQTITLPERQIPGYSPARRRQRRHSRHRQHQCPIRQ